MYRGRFSDIGTAWAVAIALVLAEQVQENAELQGMLARDAAGCKGRRT